MLILVLLAGAVVVPALLQLIPVQAYAIGSQSLEPAVARGSLLIVSTDAADEGDVIAYGGPTGSVRFDRVAEVRAGEGEATYMTVGEADQRTDAFLIPEDHVEGTVDAEVPLLGFLWLTPVWLHGVLFTGSVLAYIGLLALDRGSLTRRSQWIGRSLGLLVVLFSLQIASAGIGSTWPQATLTADVAETPPVPLEPGPSASATITDNKASATVEVPPPKLWKETVLWGCDPVAGGCSHTPSGSTYASVDGSLTRVDVAEYAPSPTFFLEVHAEAPSGGELSVQLADADTGGAVAGSDVSVTSTSPTLARSGGFSLTGAADYLFETKVTGASGGNLTAVKLLAMQTHPSETVTRPTVASASSTSATLLWQTPSGASIWQFDGTSMDGVTAAHLEFTAHVGDGLQEDSHVRLVDRSTGNVVTTVAVPATAASPTLLRSADISGSLVAGRDYQVEYRMGSGDLDDKLYLHLARLVLPQDGFTETVQYNELSWRTSTSSTTYAPVGHPSRYAMDTQWDNRSIYFETTLAADTLGTVASAQLWDHRAAAPVSASEVSVLGTSPTRLRSSPITLNTANTTYEAQAKTGASLTKALVDNARIITHVEITHDWTRDASTAVNNAELENLPQNVAAKHGNGYRLDGSVQQIRVPDDPGLRPPSEMTAMLWYRSTDNTGTHRLIDKTSGDPAGYLMEIDGVSGNLEAKLTVDGVRTTLTAPLPAADEWHHVGLTYDGQQAALLLDGTEVDNETTTGSLSHTTNALFGGLAQGEVRVLPEALPTALDEASVAWNGSVAYVFGGETANGLSADIIRYAPAEGQVTTMGASLPTARKEASATWADGVAYVFGGEDANGRLDEVVRYDPSTDTVTTMNATLPAKRDGTSAVWTGSDAYVFGGQQKGSVGVGPFSDKIVRYAPGEDTTQNMTARLPSGRASTMAFWSGTYAYILGGQEQGGALSQIVRFDPGTDTRTLLDATLPDRVKDAAVAWTGSDAYLLGGCSDACPTDRVFRFTPSTGTTIVAAGRLPSAHQAAVAVWYPDAAYVMGGDNGEVPLDEIAKWVPGAGRFQGTLDELRIYDVALTAAEIADLKDRPYHDGGSPSSDPSHGPRRIGGERLLLQTDGDDHLRPMEGKVYNHVLESSNELGACTWALHLQETSTSNPDRIDRSTIQLDNGTPIDQVKIQRGILQTSSGTAVTVAPGETAHYIVEHVPRTEGSTVVETELRGLCQEANIETLQTITWRLE